ncbi:hypothetical protein EV213_11511 [Aureibacillus halotolerans]|uniref:Uncharacterized protein n=1 Tax=Aureibacillus halotolerans TaxID=1508390 RepID=A0A4R6TTC7_9BACI|nr:hypothetical protein EV213_11511 [Aureibacillus halotolerans]
MTTAPSKYFACTLKGIRSTSIREYLIVYSLLWGTASASSEKQAFRGDLQLALIPLESTYVDYAEVCFCVFTKQDKYVHRFKQN